MFDKFMSNDPNKKISPDKKFYAETNGAILRVVSREDETKHYSLALNQYELRKPEIFRWSADSSAVGMFIIKGVLSDVGGYMSAKANFWLGIWYPFRQEFYTVHIPEQTKLESGDYLVDSIEVLAEDSTVICLVKGKEFKRFRMPDAPALSNWLKEKRDLEKTETKPSDFNKREWTWNENQYGYEGVHIYGGEVTWFQHSHNPHHGGAACSQSFKDFLENGPSCTTPGEYFTELYETVKFIASQKKN